MVMRPAIGPSFTERIPLTRAETLGRVLIHMRRSPDTRMLVTRSSIELVLRELTAAEKAAGVPLGVQLRTRVVSVRAALTGTAPASASGPDEPIRDFDESEALLPMLNYEHAKLRARAARREDQPANWEFVRHRDRFLKLGADGDAARVPLLPGASQAFTFGDTVHRLMRCDFTPYHRLRMIALYLRNRARSAG
jgi:hypothetical protein